LPARRGVAATRKPMNPVTDRAAMFAQLRAGMAELGLGAEVATVDLLLDYL